MSITIGERTVQWLVNKKLYIMKRMSVEYRVWTAADRPIKGVSETMVHYVCAR
jgi:hypothetical protein